MRTVTVSRFGGPEVLEVSERPLPTRRAGQVLVRVEAAAVNPTDVLLRRGGQAARLSPFPPPYVLGMDLAGTVQDVDAGSRWPVGQRVMGVVTPWRADGGAQAEWVVVEESSLAPIPDRLDFVEAATVSMNGLTARSALNLLGLAPGSTLLVSGAAGAVGGCVVEMAGAAGLRVVAIASNADRPALSRMGADLVIAQAHRSESPAAGVRQALGGAVDGVVDAANLGASLLATVRDGGRMARVRPTDAVAERDIMIVDVFVPDCLHDSVGLAEISALCATGALTPRVAAVFTPDDVAQAHALLEAGGLRGRPVLRMS